MISWKTVNRTALPNGSVPSELSHLSPHTLYDCRSYNNSSPSHNPHKLKIAQSHSLTLHTTFIALKS